MSTSTPVAAGGDSNSGIDFSFSALHRPSLIFRLHQALLDSDVKKDDQDFAI